MSRKFPRVCAVALGVLFFNISSSVAGAVWRQYGFDAAHTSFNDNETILNRSNVSRLVHAWSVRVGQTDPSTPVLGFSNLFFSTDGQVTALKARSGNKLWETLSCSTFQAAQPALGQGGVLIVGDLAGYDPSPAFRCGVSESVALSNRRRQ